MSAILALALFVAIATIVKIGVRRVFRGPARPGLRAGAGRRAARPKPAARATGRRGR